MARLLRSAEDVGAWLLARQGQLPACGSLWTGMPDLASLRERIEAQVDRRGRVLDDATPALARIRSEIRRLVEELERSIREIAGRANLRSAFADGTARVHRRGARRVLAIRQRHAGRVPGIVHDRSQTGETLFVEPRQIVELGNRAAELEADAEREVARVLAELTRDVLQRRESIEACVGRIAELELALVAARYAESVGGRPALQPGESVPGPGTAAARGLLLRGWRHPLLLAQQAAGRLDEVTPIDLRLGADFDLLVVTGPNTGGKTLALKGAGLAALMTRMGLALPCEEGTTVPLFDGIVADIGDEQEIQQSLSTFSSHLVRIQGGLERAGPNTLCLLDELGGGTDPTEGAALGEAILERLLRLRAPTLASTHLGQLKEFAYRFDRAENGHVEFDLETLAPRYTLVIGAPGRSRALAIARRLGLPDELVDRAEERLESGSGDVEALMDQMRGTRLEAERLRSEAEERNVQLARRLAEVDEVRAALDVKRGHLEAEAQRGLEERVARTRTWLERARALLPRLPRELRDEVAELLGGIEEALEGASLTDRRRAFLAGLKKDSIVWLPRFKKRCAVTRIFRERRELGVRLGKREMTVSFDDVTFYESL